MKKFIICLASAALALTSCQCNKPTYESVYDQMADCGQYTMPEQKFGKNYWTLIPAKAEGEDKMVAAILDESISGLTALSVNEGAGETMVWMQVDNEVYNRLKDSLPMENLGNVTAWELLAKEETRAAVKGYVLYDLKNQESTHAATVAAHVCKGVMIDKRDRSKIEALNYQMLFDASKMTLADSWAKFKDSCENNALVLMPAYSSNQRSTAIASKLMVVNLNKTTGKPEFGNNKELIIEVLNWLQPLSPVFGWEQAVGEDAFVGLVSSTGNFMIPYDWTVNTPLMWADYKNRQRGLVKVTDPTKINYGDAKHYMSFYMSDGDNVQWMFTGFDNEHYYSNPNAAKCKMTFGFPVTNLSMVSPDQYGHLLDKQNPEVALMESLGGGYYYADNFAEMKNRPAILDKAAKTVATHMRQHRNKVLALVCMDVTSDGAREAYQAYVDNNDELVGIVVIQYTPYAGGMGETMWFKNSKGYDIPVLTVRYSIWNYGPGVNGELEGTPAYIASKYNTMAVDSLQSTFSVTSVHAWSSFTKTNDPADLTGENAPGGTLHGVESAVMCQEKLTGDMKVVNVEELIWQLRMHKYPEQTKEILKTYKQ